MKTSRDGARLSKRLFLILPLFLLACDFGSFSGPFILPATPTTPPSVTSPAMAASATLTPSPSETISPTSTSTVPITLTPTETFTSQPSSTPTATVNLYTYIFPIQPPRLASFSKGGHPFPATDIFAPIGTRFVAVTNGTVDAVSYVDTWNPATNIASTDGGLYVRILGDDGFHYYGAHLSAIANGIHVGVWVPAGKLLGLVGNSGDARFTNPHVHFEVAIPEAPFTKLEPFPLLSAWLAGEQITPALPTATPTFSRTPLPTSSPTP